MEFGVGMELHRSEVRLSVLDIGFSSCTVPAFCQSLGISDVGNQVWGSAGSRFRVRWDEKTRVLARVQECRRQSEDES